VDWAEWFLCFDFLSGVPLMKSGKQPPALRDFLRGYFHEDCIEEYGSLEAAARQFVKDADVDERKAVAREWGEFLKSVGKSSLGNVNAALTELGSACVFASLDEVKSVDAVVKTGPPRR
jgi:hypothetical protein